MEAAAVARGRVIVYTGPMTERHIAFDTETTGLDPAGGHRVVEIGCVEMFDYIRSGRTFHAYLNPERDMPADAEKIHGLSAAFLADKPLFKDVAQSFLEFVGDGLLVAHNAGFDMKFINYELQSAGFRTLGAERAFDTVAAARKKYPGQPASLDALCRRFSIDLSGRVKHGALLDAELLAEVYLELMGGRQASFGLQEENVLERTGSGSGNGAYTASFPRRYFHPSASETTAHQLFVEKYLKNPVWNAMAAE